MTNGRILTQSERDRAIMSQLETENADLEWKRMAAEANAQISIAGQANWRTRAIAAEAQLAEADAIIKEVGDLAPFYSANNMREAAITRTKRDFSQPDAPVQTKCLEIRTIFAAQAWERKRNNG